MKRSSKLWVLLGLTVVAVVVVFCLPRIGQTPGYHDFADYRKLWGIPNCWNVLSNLPFVMVGAVGLLSIWKARVPAAAAWMYGVLFAGVLLTGFGSAYYHWHQDNDTLVWDRIPMTLVFMSLLAATVMELVSRRLSGRELMPLAKIGGLTPMYKTLRELHTFGYIQYQPSFNSLEKSKVYLPLCETMRYRCKT